MRTEKRKVNLADASEKQAQHQQREFERQQRKQRNKGVSPSPIIGLFAGAGGTIGSAVIWLNGYPLIFAILASILGCVGAAISRGDSDDYDGLGARICMASALVSLLMGMIILTVYLKGLGLWDFASK